MNYLNKFLVLSASVLSAVSIVTTAQASTIDGSAVNQSVSESESLMTKIRKLPISLSDYSLIFGPAVNDPLSNKTPDAEIDKYTGLSSLHYVTLSYRLSDMFKISPVAEFSYNLTDPDRTNQQRFVLSDPYLRLSASSILEQNIRNTGNILSLDGDVRYYAPFSKSSRNNHTLGEVRVSVNPALQFANSDFSISTTNYFKYWLQPDADERTLPLAKLYTGPQVNYRLNDRVTAFALYEAAYIVNTANSANVDDPGTSAADVQPGAEIKVVKNVTVIPYLNWYINQPIRTTSINMNLDITLF